MKFMIIVKATKEMEAATSPGKGIPNFEEIVSEMADYHEELAKAGALVDASGLHPTSKGWQIRYSGGKRTIIDRPFAETKELIAGYTLIEVNTREEALEWTRRFPNPRGKEMEAEIEVRQLYELDEFEPSADIDRFRKMKAELKK
jgi:hypothetical protein